MGKLQKIEKHGFGAGAPYLYLYFAEYFISALDYQSYNHLWKLLSQMVTAVAIRGDVYQIIPHKGIKAYIIKGLQGNEL